MSYIRVIPRDLFNEANLLKCFGRLWIETERFRCVRIEHDGDPFQIEQNEDSGSLSIANVQVRIGGRSCQVWRPLNSRDAWPLYLQVGDEDEIRVFTDEGALSSEMMALIEAAS